MIRTLLFEYGQYYQIHGLKLVLDKFTVRSLIYNYNHRNTLDKNPVKGDKI
jgi:hypothetical protein